VGGVYLISKASLRQRNPKFNHTAHDYEIYLDPNSSLVPCAEDADSAGIPNIVFHVSPGEGGAKGCGGGGG
jgi:hypothetical protein